MDHKPTEQLLRTFYSVTGGALRFSVFVKGNHSKLFQAWNVRNLNHAAFTNIEIRKKRVWFDPPKSLLSYVITYRWYTVYIRKSLGYWNEIAFATSPFLCCCLSLVTYPVTQDLYFLPSLQALSLVGPQTIEELKALAVDMFSDIVSDAPDNTDR